MTEPPPLPLLTPRRLAIAAGGTAGHIMPALAVAEAYRARLPDAEILFVGTELGLERHLVPAAGNRLELIDGAPLFGVSWPRRLLAVLHLGRGMWQARRLFRRERVQLVIGFGGYASAGALLAARSLRLPTVIHDGNAVPGLANRWLGKIVDRVLLTFAEALPFCVAEKARVVGFPVRGAYAALGAQRVAPPANRARHVLVTGGSLGSSFLNRELPPVLARVVQQGCAIEVIHQSGNVGGAEQAMRDRRFSVPDLAALRSDYAQRNVPASVVPYIDDMAAAYAWADIAITCAGTASLSELAAAGLPALVVPLAAASQDHQRANAAAFARISDVWWLAESAWDPASVAAQLHRLLSQPSAWEQASRAVRAAGAADAARRVIEECEALIAERT